MSLECAEEVEAQPPQQLLLSSSGSEDLAARLAALLELQLAARRALLEARPSGPQLFHCLARRDGRDCRRAMVEYASRIVSAPSKIAGIHAICGWACGGLVLVVVDGGVVERRGRAASAVICYWIVAGLA